MKLVTKSHVYVCQETFTPVQDVTIQVPLELLQDLSSLNRDELAQVVGEKFLQALGLFDEPMHAPTC